MGPVRLHLFALLWGVAEATLFFVVPDVLLTYIAATKERRTALMACIFALTGALLGGFAMYFWAQYNSSQALFVLASVPAISGELINSVGLALQIDGLASLFPGAIAGRPYKVFAVQAGIQGFSPLAFLAVSIPARLFRWMSLMLIAWVLGRILNGLGSQKLARNIVIFSWVVFYAVFWAVIPG
jgi:membrane protein DedA with SNARE-associated domain